MKVLHIVREPNDNRPLEMAEIQQRQGNEVALLLIHDAVLAVPRTNIKTLLCRDDVEARGIKTDAEKVDYDEIIRLIFAYNSVTCW